MIDFVGFVLSRVSFTGSPPGWTKVTTSLRGYLRSAPSTLLAGWRTLIGNVRNASSTASRLKAVGELVWEIFNQGGSMILNAFKSSLSWWEWVLSGASILLALGAFTVSGGAWLTVSLVSAVYSSVSLMMSIMAVINACVGSG